MSNVLQERYAEALLEHIRRDTYPSVTHMNMLEDVAPPEVLLRYTLHLIDEIENDPHPSIPMMQRVSRLIAAFGG